MLNIIIEHGDVKDSSGRVIGEVHSVAYDRGGVSFTIDTNDVDTRAALLGTVPESEKFRADL